MCQCCIVCDTSEAWIKCSILWIPRECFVPACIAQYLKVLVHNVGGHDGVDNKLPKALPLVIGLVDGAAKRLVLIIHQQVPRQVNRVLLGDALSLVVIRQFRFLLDKL
jgi:hypothetical protein